MTWRLKQNQKYPGQNHIIYSYNLPSFLQTLLLFFRLGRPSKTSKSNIAKLQLVQNFVARLLSDKRKFDHISPTLRKLKLLPVSDILYMRDAVQMYKWWNA